MSNSHRTRAHGPHPIVARLRVPSPLGTMTLAATDRGLASAWFDEGWRDPPAVDSPEVPEHPILRQAACELAAYWHDPRRAFSVPLDPAGTPFQRRVWQALARIASGSTTSYGEVARRIGRPHAARAVGAAVGRNPLGVIVPCHRVIGRDGTLTGYAGGLPRKQALLRHEGLHA